MSALFAVSRQDPTTYVAKDGQHFNREMDARRYNAELAMIKALTRGRDSLDSLTLVRGICDHMPVDDISRLRDMVKAHVGTIEPQFLAIPGKVGWVKEGGRQVRYPITLAWGDTSDDRQDAAHATLKAMLQWQASDHVVPYGGIAEAIPAMLDDEGLTLQKLGKAGVYALCGVWHLVNDPAAARRELSAYRLTSGFKDVLERRDAKGRLVPGQAGRLLAALDAALKEIATEVAPRR